jgi:hypothetical protein
MLTGIRSLGGVNLEIAVVDEHVRVPEEAHAKDHVVVSAGVGTDRLETTDADQFTGFRRQVDVQVGIERVNGEINTAKLTDLNNDPLEGVPVNY